MALPHTIIPYIYLMKLIRISVVVAFLCQSGEAVERHTAATDFEAAKRGFLQYPMLKKGVDVVPSPALRRAEKTFHFNDSLSLFRVLTRRTYKDSKVLELHPGDLNADGLEDMLVLATRTPKKSEKLAHEFQRVGQVKCRRVILFLQSEDGTYRFVTYSNKIVENRVAGSTRADDSYSGIHVSNGKIAFKSTFGTYWRTIVTRTYAYVPGYQYWYLETVMKESFRAEAGANPLGKRDTVLLTADDFRRKKF